MAGTTNMPDLRTRLTLDIGDFTRGLVSARAQASLFGGTIQDVGSQFATAGIAMATFATISLFTAGIIVTAFLGAIGVLMTLGAVSAFQSQQVKDAWTKTATVLKLGMENAARAYVPVLERLAVKVSDTFAQMQPALTAVFDRLAPIFEDMSVSFLGWMNQVVQQMPSMVNNVIAFLAEIGPAWDQTTSNMRSGLDQIGAAFGSFGETFLKEALPPFGQAVGNILALIAPMIESASAFGGAFFQSLADITGGMDTLLANILHKLNPGFQTLAVTLGDIGLGILSALSGVGDPLAQLLGDLSTFGGYVANLFNGLGPTVTGLLQAAANVGTELLPVFKAIGTFLVELGPAAVALADMIASMIGGFIQGIMPLLGDLGPDWGLNFAAGIKAITPAMTELAKITGQFVTFLVTGAGMIINALSAVTNVVLGLTGIFQTTGFDAGKALVIGIIAGLGLMISPLAGVIAGVVAIIGAYLPRSPAEVGPLSGDGSPDQRGMKLGEMFAAGITASSGLVATAAQKLVGAVVLPTNAATLGSPGGMPVQSIGQMAASAGNTVINIAGSVIAERDLQDMLQKAGLQRENRNAGSVLATAVRGN